MAELNLTGLIESGTSVATAMVAGAADFIEGLYTANPIGQFIVVAGIASAVIAVGKSLFLKRKHV